MKHLILICISFSIIFGCKMNSESNNQKETTPDYTLIQSTLDSIQNEDQKYRKRIPSVDKEFGWESDQMKALWDTINRADSGNLIIVEDILDNHGWIGSDKIGRNANRTLFLVVQHANQETQEKYIDMIRQAVKDGKARAKSLALMEDRLGLDQGKLQVYGSQIGTDRSTGKTYVLPLEDPDNVNKRRASVGLQPLEDYVKGFDMVWDVEDYKKKLSKYIELEEIRRNKK